MSSTAKLKGRTRLETKEFKVHLKGGSITANLMCKSEGRRMSRGFKFQRGDAGRICRDELHAVNRILNSGTTASSSSVIGNLNMNRCSSGEGLGSLLKRLS